MEANYCIKGGVYYLFDQGYQKPPVFRGFKCILEL